MKTFPIKNLSFAAVIALFLFSCGEEVETPQIDQMDFDVLTGKWSITREVEKYFEQDGSLLETVSTDYDVNTFTVEFLTATMARIIQVEEGMWAEADYALNQADSTLSISFSVGGEDMEIVLKILELNDTDATLYEVGQEDFEGNTILYENNLTFTKNDAAVAAITEEDLKVKWSMASQSILGIADENEDGEFDETTEVMMEMEWADIPHNRYSIEFLPDGAVRVIDSYVESAVDEESTWEMIDGSNIVIAHSESEKTLIHIKAFDGSALEAMYISYEEEDLGGSTMYTKMKGQLALTKNDGSEPTMSKAQLVGSWSITGFAEYMDGIEVEVPTEDSPLGATIRFEEDGTGLILMGQDDIQLTWKTIDGSNFCFTELLAGEEPETILLNIKSYDEGTGILNVVEGSMEFDGSTDSDVLRESRVQLVKNS